MSDNIAITAGTGTSVATDDCGAAGHTQIIKLAHSTDGSATLVPASSTDGLLVNLGANNDVTVTSGTITLGAGTAAFGKLAANSGVDIGDVDVTSCALPTGASTAAKQPALGTAGTASSDVITVQGIAAMTPILSTLSGTNNIATVTTVTTLGTITNVVHVDDNSGSLTVDGAVTVTNATAANLKCEATIAAAQTIAVTNAGTFAVQESGTWVQVDDAAFTPGTSKIAMIGFEADETATDSVDEGDGGAARMTLDRKQIVTTQPHAAGGLSIFRSLDLDETEEEVKGTAGCIYKLRIANASTSARYVKVYDNTAAGTTVGSTTPIDTIVVPGATSASQPTVITEAYGGLGITCSTGITVAATTALADADTGAPSANDVVVTVLYK